jgi:hypothetical protein
MASAGNWFYTEKRALGMSKVQVHADYSARLGSQDDLFMIDRVIEVVDPSDNMTITVGDASTIGQEILIVTSSNDDSKTVTVSFSHHSTTDPETGTISTVDQYVRGLWTGTEWVTESGSWTI